MSDSADKQFRIEGTVASGFESVKRLYEHNMRTLAEESTQLCVYHGEEKVVDLWASITDNTEFSADSLINVFSSGKSLEAIAIASLVGKGMMDYNARITDYWPEFGANGKGDLTVADLMRHEAGLPELDTSMEPQDLLTENIKLNKVGRVIEGHAQKYRKGDGHRREYHAITRGWIVNELFRRVDPARRTIGEFLREDISDPLEIDVVVGVKEEELHRVKKVAPLGFRFQFWESLKPKFLKRRIEQNIFQILGKLIRLIPAIRNATIGRAPPPFKGMDRITFFNEPIIAMGETPSANANCSARGLAKLAAMMAAGGKWAGTEYMTLEGWNALHEDPLAADMGFVTTKFTQGGVALFAEPAQKSSKIEKALNTGREGFYGWMGLGGSLFQWHPQLRIGFGYVPTSLNILDLVNERGKAYQAEVIHCLEKINMRADDPNEYVAGENHSSAAAISP
jgi:CubicO group peptidase (beta-lactamase class C family)